jgi:uncharacterized membrane protein YedE/YeeE
VAIWQTVITVLATLAGTITGTVLTSALKSRSDRVARVHEWQVEVVKIYGDLMTALSDHYAAMWDLEAARIRGDQAEIEAALAASLPTRSAITRPHVQLVVLASMLRTEIDAAVHTVYAMDTATDDTARTHDQLTARRHAAKTAMATLSTATAGVLVGLGAGLPGLAEPDRRITRP